MRKTIVLILIIFLNVLLCFAEVINPNELKLKSTYILELETILKSKSIIYNSNPKYNLYEKNDKIIPELGKIFIDGNFLKNGIVWYNVKAYNFNNDFIGEGVVCSDALIGQDLICINKQQNTPNYNNSNSSAYRKSLCFYEIVKKENFDFRDINTQKYIHRIQYRVKLKKECLETELTEISKEIISQAPKAEAISILFYLPDTETNGAYTAGIATWAPGGKWEDANKSYTKKLELKYGGSLGKVDSNNIIDLPLSKKKEIFYNLVKYEDQGMNGYQSNEQIAKDYGLTIEVVKKIANEGILKNWPMP